MIPLRDRIADLLAHHPAFNLKDDGYSAEDVLRMADAVIRELCLHREEMSEWAVLSEGFRGHRYVTHWEENDPAPVTKIRSAEKLGLTGDGE